MINQAMTKIQQLIFLLLAIFSVPSAFMYGISVPIGRGMVSLLDSTFYSGMARLTVTPGAIAHQMATGWFTNPR